MSNDNPEYDPETYSVANAKIMSDYFEQQHGSQVDSLSNTPSPRPSKR